MKDVTVKCANCGAKNHREWVDLNLRYRTKGICSKCGKVISFPARQQVKGD